MTFSEVLKSLKEGKKFSRERWKGSDLYLALSSSGRVVLHNNSYHTMVLEDCEADDWFEVK